MVRRFYLLVCVSILVQGLVGTASIAIRSACDYSEQNAGLCIAAHNDPDSVTIEGSSHQAGGENIPGGAGAGRRAAPGKPRTRGLPEVEARRAWDGLCYADVDCDGRGPAGLNPFFPRVPAPPADAAEPGAPAAAITIADVARFLPATAEMHAEPDGWAVVGVPANFWIEVEPVVVEGELLGGPADVRFTPRAYQWVYGDGGSRTTAAGGASWAALGQEELTSTGTSHSYEDRARVHAHVTVLYSADYRIDGGVWVPIDGAVAGDTPPTPVLVVKERTVLTAAAPR